MFYRVRDKEEFKKANIDNWLRNAEFWLQSDLQHIKDVASTVANSLRTIINANETSDTMRLIDCGCGDGWLLDLIANEDIRITEYTGIDLTEAFIGKLRDKYEGVTNIRFILADLEEAPPTHLIGSAQIVINFFNFFELANIETAFDNVSRFLAPSGTLLILTVDPVVQLFSICQSYESFREILMQYEELKYDLAYDKEIDIGEKQTGRVYKGFLYSVGYYVELARRADLRLIDYQEIVKTNRAKPQIYQFASFSKFP